MAGEGGLGLRAMPGVNAGYQRDDRELVDYQLWPIADQQARGPAPALDRPFGVALGAAQVFGRFCETPFPAQVGAAIGLPMLNFGFSGSGPSFFLQRPELIEIANRARFAIVHMMSGRSVSNSRVVLGKNQGLAFLRDTPEAPPVFAEDAYKSLLRSLPVAELARLRAETRLRYVDEMRRLMAAIRVPKVLLYWAQRPVDYAESLRSVAGYWGDFPHFVNREVVDLLRLAADHYVEVVSGRGIPQPLFSRATGLPYEIWPADKFPNVALRDHNYYYPSPEMNDDAAAALLPACRNLMAATTDAADMPRRSPPAPRRRLLAHLDIFGNAEPVLASALRESFESHYLATGPAGGDQEALVARLEEDRSVKAVSSYRWRFELAGRLDAEVRTIVLLRHPLLRAKALYDYERDAARQQDSQSLHTRVAGSSTLGEWIDWCLSQPASAAPIANYQTRVCGRLANGSRDEDWNREVTLATFQEAAEALATAEVGIVEDLERALPRIEAALLPLFPGLRLLAHDAGGFRATPEEIATQVAALESQLGERSFAALASANAFDLLLHERACASD